MEWYKGMVALRHHNSPASSLLTQVSSTTFFKGGTRRSPLVRSFCLYIPTQPARWKRPGKNWRISLGSKREYPPTHPSPSAKFVGGLGPPTQKFPNANAGFLVFDTSCSVDLLLPKSAFFARSFNQFAGATAESLCLWRFGFGDPDFDGFHDDTFGKITSDPWLCQQPDLPGWDFSKDDGWIWVFPKIMVPKSSIFIGFSIIFNHPFWG